MTVLQLILLAVAGLCAAQEHFFFKRAPAAQTVVAGQPARLQCLASRAQGLQYHWQLDGARLRNSTRVQQVGPDLLIRRVDPMRDGGDFTCVATNASSGFSQTTGPAALNIIWLGETAQVHLRQPDAAAKLAPGADVTLVCAVEGSDDVSYDWFRNAERLQRGERGDRLQLKGRRLHLRNASAQDAGVYRCRASNRAGTTNSSRNFALAIPDDRFPLLVEAPGDAVVRRGGVARLHCGFRGADFTEWFGDGSEPLANTSRITVFANGSLHISDVGPEDEGLYTCVGAKGQESQSYAAELRIAYLEALTTESLEPALGASGARVVAERAPFEATCLAPRGDPPPRVWWRDPRNRTVTDAGAVRVDDGRLLVEAASARDHAGAYTCVADNLAGSREISLTLVVATQPRIINPPTQDPPSGAVYEEAKAVFHCEYEAMEPPISTVEWLKDGILISEDRHRFKIQRGKSNSTLVINAVTMSDEGVYACQVNTIGFAPVVSENASLSVKERLKFSPKPVSKKLELGTPSTVYCRAQGSHPPTIKWFKSCQDTKQCKTSVDLPSHVQDINGTLEFRNVTLEDRGNYTCMATNKQGSISATIDIDVIVTPKFRVPPQNVTAYEGYPVILHCAAEGLPQPTIKWDRNSNLSALPSGFEVLSNGSLWSREVHISDGGKYGCTAGNSGGFKREEVTLIVESNEGYQPSEGIEQGETMMTKTVGITLGAAAAYMVLVVGLMAWCRHRRRKRKQAGLDAPAAEGTHALLGKVENGDVIMTDHHETKEHHKHEKKEKKERPRSDGDTTQSQGSNHSKKSKTGLDRLNFPRSDLHSFVLLGRGQFGEIQLAQAKGIKEGSDVVVLVKALQPTRDDIILQEFKREIDLFTKPSHPNVAKLIGLCRDAEPNLMVLEYTDWGDLKQFLLATRGGGKDKDASPPSSRPRPPPLSVAQIMNMALQVAQGMDHLAGLRLVHKDMAARNCLITSGLAVKVSLVAISKDTYSKEYFLHHNQLIPLRWLPAEAVLEDDFSTKSDVYMWAVLVWELFHQGELPFVKMSDDAVLAAMKRHELALKPHKAAPEALQSLLNSCWAESPRDRPTFSQVTTSLTDITGENTI
ncbi:hypothetical protein R5R35_006628 [Gryllus longicercus]|uniref:Inactive tyrosine-protein kinase 7 n=1 Tax=Gryllus longicercus TaxID=2509291 RepID=A0AAN9VPY1_9ORTH